jgi:hypothetical protein
MKAKLIKFASELFHAELSGDRSGLSGDCSGLSGDRSGLSGNCSRLYGNCSRLYGNCSGLYGDLNDCEITQKDRNLKIEISTLVKP